jgi:dTDP-4-dehydrorhamnose reductase
MGQVGWELRRTLPALGEVVALGKAEMDLTRPDEIVRLVRDMRPDVVVNAAAYTAVDRAESEREIARSVNAVAPRILAEELRKTGGLLIHYSTDYVFDGSKPAPYVEDDHPAPLSVYGATKLEGERAIQALAGAHLIFRTSWVYGSRGKNFLLTMLNLFERQSELRIVRDQIGAPTWCRWLAESTADILAQYLQPAPGHAWLEEHSGIYHMTAGGSTSWFGFASEILALHVAEEGARRPNLVPIPSTDYPLPARRPANSVLDNAKLWTEFGVVQPPWPSLLRRCMAELAPA